MPIESDFHASTPGAEVSGTLRDRNMAQPVAPIPGLQAIGPRVTFNFVTEPWNIGNSYSYYDVVNDAGASYVARQNVPSGIELTDTDYWFKWNDPNAQLAELLNQVQSFDGRITAAQGDATSAMEGVSELRESDAELLSQVQSLDGRVTAAQEDATSAMEGVSELRENDVNELRTNVSELSTNVNELSTTLGQFPLRRWEGKKIVTIGDSIMLGTATSNASTMGVHARIASLLGATVYNYAENNAGFLTAGTGSRHANFLQQIQAAASDHPDADAIIISGGCNDATVSGDCYSAAKAAISAALEGFEHAVVYTAPFQYGACQGGDNISHGNNGRNLTIISDIQRATLESGALLISHCWEMMVGRTDLMADGVHPNDAGALVQAQKIVMGMYGYDYRPSYNDNCTAGSGIDLNEVICQVVDGMVHLDGVAKTTGAIGAFSTIINLPAYASRAVSRGNTGYISNGWSFVPLYHSGVEINTTVPIASETDIYLQPTCWALGM